MPIVARSSFHPFIRRFSLCTYVSKAKGYDALSKPILRFKDGKDDVFSTWADWATDKLKETNIKFDVIIRVLGSKETITMKEHPVNKLAHHLRLQLKTGYLPTLLGKTRPTRPMKEFKTEPERRAELDGVYFIKTKHDLDGKTILLIDDIRTSGTTSDVIGELLLETYKDVKLYLFTIAQNDDANSQETLDTFEIYKFAR